MRYAPGWLPDGLQEVWRFGDVSGSPSTGVSSGCGCPRAWWGFGWDPEPGVRVSVQQRGPGLDQDTMYRIARSMRPVADEFTFPLQARQLPAGLTELSWNSWVAGAVRLDPRSGEWSGR